MEKAMSATVAMPSDREIVITREFNAPRALVFDAWTKAEQVAQWWDPSQVPLAVCKIDLRPNGAFHFVNQGQHGDGQEFAGIYREIARPSRLVFTTQAPRDGQSIGTLVFSEHEGKTTLTMTIVCPSREARDAMLAMRVDAGTIRTLENLDEYLTSGRDGRNMG